MKINLSRRIAALMGALRALQSRIEATDGVIVLRVEAIKVSPGDLVVLSTPFQLTRDAATRIREEWERMVKVLGVEGAQAVVLERGMTVSVLRPDRIEPAAKDEAA